MSIQLYFCTAGYRVYNRQTTLYRISNIISDLDGPTYSSSTGFLIYILGRNGKIA